MLYTFYDTETSGLEQNCDVLSFSYMLADENLNVKKAETLYFWKEGVTQWTQEAYEINKLSKEFLRQYADDYEKNLRKMYLTLSYASLVGYNSGWTDVHGVVHGFDFPKCKSFLYRNHLPEPRPLEFIDVMKLTEFRYKRRYKLQKIFDVAGLSRGMADVFTNMYFPDKAEAHTSGYDVTCTALLFNKYHNEGVFAEEDANRATFSMSVNTTEDMWYLYFDSGELKSACVTTLSDGGVKCKLYTMAELLDTDASIFEFLMKNPDAHMCDYADVQQYLSEEEDMSSV